MEFSIKQGSPEKLHSGCVLVGVFESGKLTDAAQVLDKSAQHYISDIIARGDMTGKAATTLLLHSVPAVASERVLLLGLGKPAELDARQYRDCVRAAMRALQATNAKEVLLYLAELPVKGRDSAWCISQAVLAAYETAYRFDRLKSKPEKNKKVLQKIQFGLLAAKPTAALNTAVSQADATAQGMILAKDLGNLPGNVCTPTYLAQQALTLAKKHKTIKTTVLDEKDMQKLGMGSLLSVTRGSAEPAKLITMQYLGADKTQKPIVLVGKGVTFDSGGISLKPGAEMDEMKYDMCGAASVLGTVQAIAEMGLKLNVVGIIPSCDNMPSGTATKPGDIVTSMSGQTIEILNTDAEGRLILCDALTYAAKFDPDTVIDIATLTGACVIALGHVASGLFSNQDKLAHELLAAGEQSQDRAWHMPLWEEYQPQLDSNFADMQNIGGRAGGSVTAACFLSRFTKDYRWAHLDIAGTAWKSGKDKGATGRPVPLLTQYLVNRAAGSK
ncbi:MAG: leucyl aminopeptidase [Gallionellales bacterium 35-53-114]|nr:MAG: leucyl aminopeptidase [Gallionellales bacterium 35-53-114]OYZ64119.1 MAG: leucyl aminopeptidase [Gallionellales bacterium 24-53-125]OZB10568.1 MAG: leucyl aminopeptidase [Gallionellales bacterium 39-52-133]HQS57197.1 leucyl aminopeptidase [Gallionellaceae bacterium]HQS74615.1 leucyl aminopeptidase [Gallionellaceae bacterium]